MMTWAFGPCGGPIFARARAWSARMRPSDLRGYGDYVRVFPCVACPDPTTPPSQRIVRVSTLHRIGRLVEVSSLPDPAFAGRLSL